MLPLFTTPLSVIQDRCTGVMQPTQSLVIKVVVAANYYVLWSSLPIYLLMKNKCTADCLTPLTGLIMMHAYIYKIDNPPVKQES